MLFAPQILHELILLIRISGGKQSVLWGGGGGKLESSQYSDSVICIKKVKISNKKNALSPNGNVKNSKFACKGKITRQQVMLKIT